MPSRAGLRHVLRRGPRFLAAALAMALLSGCQGGILDPEGPVGRGDSAIMIDALLIMLAVAIPTILLAYWIAWRFRASNTKAPYWPQWSYSGRIEAVTWAIPTLVIMFLGGVIWIGSYELDPFKPLQPNKPSLEVDVVSLDWKWLFVYPKENIATVNQLVIPAGVPVHFSITSASVFNTFFIPQLGSMIYAMPGMVSQLYLQADAPGEMLGESGHFSGDGFSDMNFRVKSVVPASFANWVQTMRGQGATLDRAAYAALARQSQHVKPFGYRSVDPDLFNAIATEKIGPAPGPEPETAEHAGREVSAGGRP